MEFPNDIDKLARRIESRYTWKDIVLPEDVLKRLKEIAEQVSQHRKLSALFAGPSGTGKTMAADVLANSLRLELYRIDLSRVVSKYIGETEKNLARIFDAADQSDFILFFDEADALFGKRNGVKDSHDRYANIEVSYLLERMEGYRGLAILATNRRTNLDQVFLRRLRYILEFPFPDTDSRRRIWRKVFPAKIPMAKFDLDRLAQFEINGAGIRDIATNAVSTAAAEQRPLEMAHVMKAARRK